MTYRSKGKKNNPFGLILSAYPRLRQNFQPYRPAQKKPLPSPLPPQGKEWRNKAQTYNSNKNRTQILAFQPPFGLKGNKYHINNEGDPPALARAVIRRSLLTYISKASRHTNYRLFSKPDNREPSPPATGPTLKALTIQYFVTLHWNEIAEGDSNIRYISIREF